MRSGRSGYRSW